MTTQLTPIQQLAYEAVVEIIEVKTGQTEPCVARLSEVRNSFNAELTEALRELCRRGILGVSLDLNKNPMFRIKNPL